MIKGVIFDMDGVMVDTERQSTKGWLAAAKRHKVEMPMWLINQFKGSPAHMSEKYFDDYFKGTLNYWQMRNERTQYINELRKVEGIPVKKGLFKLLDYIKVHNIPCAVATSTQKESAENTLHLVGACDYLRAIIYGDEVEHGKPEPDIFLRAASKINILPQDCMVIEDSVNGIKAGNRAGMYVVHVPDTIIIDEDTRKLTNVVCGDLEQVVQVIETLNNK